MVKSAGTVFTNFSSITIAAGMSHSAALVSVSMKGKKRAALMSGFPGARVHRFTKKRGAVHKRTAPRGARHPCVLVYFSRLLSNCANDSANDST
jgi:hypothetical protein